MTAVVKFVLEPAGVLIIDVPQEKEPGLVSSIAKVYDSEPLHAIFDQFVGFGCASQVSQYRFFLFWDMALEPKVCGPTRDQTSGLASEPQTNNILVKTLNSSGSKQAGDLASRAVDASSRRRRSTIPLHDILRLSWR